MTPLTVPPTTTIRRTGPEQWFHTTATLCLVQLLVCLWPVGWYRWALAPLVALTGVACAVVGTARLWRDRR